MDRYHPVGMWKQKASFSFSIRQIFLIFFERFCALNFQCSDRLTLTVPSGPRRVSAHLSTPSRWKI
jgi:hypothetical protein